MERDKVVVLGFYIVNLIFSQGSKRIKAHLSNKANINGRILLTLADYLTKYSKQFDRVSFYVTNRANQRLPNGTLAGIVGKVNRSEIDIGVQPFTMNDVGKETVVYSYPFRLYPATFVTRKAEYQPQIFDIWKTFPLSFWIAIILSLIAMSFICCVTFKRKYSFDKSLLHIFAVLLRQSSVLKPSSITENLLISSWVVGAMFLCLAYDSVVLSFLSFPPVIQVKDVPQLAKAVKEGRYHCLASRQSAIIKLLLESNDENLRIIGQDIKTNNLSHEDTFQDFLHDKSKLDLALLVDTDVIGKLILRNKFVSEERFLEGMAAMIIRKDFCCKKWVEKFTHRFMASGLYFKFQNDGAFLKRMRRDLKYEEKDTTKRKLTLIDVAPAFIFLIFGQVISFLVLMIEILPGRLKKK